VGTRPPRPDRRPRPGALLRRTVTGRPPGGTGALRTAPGPGTCAGGRFRNIRNDRHGPTGNCTEYCAQIIRLCAADEPETLSGFSEQNGGYFACRGSAGSTERDRRAAPRAPGEGAWDPGSGTEREMPGTCGRRPLRSSQGNFPIRENSRVPGSSFPAQLSPRVPRTLPGHGSGQPTSRGSRRGSHLSPAIRTSRGQGSVRPRHAVGLICRSPGWSGRCVRFVP
jgi:hypothetical protein